MNRKSHIKALRHHSYCFFFQEQIEWAVGGGADYIVVETMTGYAEAKVALDAVLKYGKGIVGYCVLTHSLEFW